MQSDESSLQPPQPESKSRLATRSSLIQDLKLEEVSQERWREFELIYKPLLLFWMRKKNVPASAEDEVLQECWISAFKAIGNFERGEDKGTFRGWLRTIVHRRAADYFRKVPKDQGVSPELLNAIATPEQKDANELEGEEVALREIEARALEVVRSTLKTKNTWDMFWMTTVEKVPTEEVAKKFNVSKAGVRMAKQRVLKRLKELGFEV
ncbi:sigma-70 family RNA polymerase sigma factor [Gimesia benthica]|uniref:Sigma-70 family RNA polymerase sigma factor n=1 Tax=Gimesia benthica TaxID=2608982 RepID=A0A6I6A6G6_9PLAN|nr:sigma-70 family RNA polymerase sigma factor [Gimesia benthica]QGQ21957.1 sigma-70 family RNA polymerase sigma factor [Gimesia benthica]